jgi:hypothetical protein
VWSARYFATSRANFEDVGRLVIAGVLSGVENKGNEDRREFTGP